MPLEHLLDEVPVVAILRGVTRDRVIDVADAIFEAGVRAIEIPLNSPDPFSSLEILCAKLGKSCLCGAGTVLGMEQVERARDAGAELIVSPNTDVSVIERASRLGLVAMPGFATATEAFTAVAAGAARLKLFPASTYGSAHLKALKTVLPKQVRLYAVGGVGPAQSQEWIDAGAAGFGFGAEMFKPDYAIEEIAERARLVVAAVRQAVEKNKK